MNSRECNALKLVFGRLLDACGGGTNAANPGCRVGQQTLSDYANLSKPDSFPPADVVGDLEEMSRTHPHHPHVTREMARRQHFALVPLPAAALNEATVIPYLGRLAKDAGSLELSVGRALGSESSPGRVAAEEVSEMEMLAKADDLIRSAVEIREFLRRRKDGDL